MGEETAISWTDHTHNHWWGCTKIAPGCDNCYAAAFDARFGGNYWDPKQKPRLTAQSNRNKPLKWNAKAEKDGKRMKVFCGSMMDWCDNKVPDQWRDNLFELIKATPMLDWQLLTKRATLIKKCLPDDWGDGYDNVWLGVTCEDMEYGYPRIDELRKIPAKVRFISAEPLLERLKNIDKHYKFIDWIIVGGESGSNYRDMEIDWAEYLVAGSETLGIPVWFKQWGGNTKNKGGCNIFGREYKQWPKT